MSISRGNGQVTPGIKAIETSYAGCLFRSRLEARWAVFFDALGIDWQYEPQGFELPSGRYLPDFFVGAPDRLNAWIEVKGQHPDSGEQLLLSELRTHTGVFSCVFFGSVPRRCGRGNYPDDTVIPGWPDGWDARAYTLDLYPTPQELIYGVAPGGGSIRQKIDSALTKARSARFEFGTQG